MLFGIVKIFVSWRSNPEGNIKSDITEISIIITINCEIFKQI